MLKRLALLLSFALGAPAAAGEVTVFAAASMADAFTEIKAGFEATGEHRVTLALAGSSVLARQIQHGAPADVFLSANPGWMDALEAEGLLSSGTRRDLAGNALVLVAADPAAAPVILSAQTDFPALLGGGKLAMALVEAVPAGIYGRAALTYYGHWEGLAPHVAQSDNVRAALALVATGAAPYGIVYATDARAEPRVRVVATFPPESHPPIRYPVAGIAGRESAAVQAFLSYLRSDDAERLLAAQGFTSPKGAP